MKEHECYKEFDLFRRMLEAEFSELEQYIVTCISAMKKHEEEWMEKQSLNSQHIVGKNQEEKRFDYKALHVSPFLVKHSLFTSVYSFLEFALKKFSIVCTCNFPHYRRRVVNYEKVYQLYSFLTDELKLDKKIIEEDWQKLNIFRDLRNSILHHNSTIGKNISSKTYEFIVNDERILFQEPGSFKIKEDEIILELLQVSKHFLFTLMKNFESRYYLSQPDMGQ